MLHKILPFLLLIATAVHAYEDPYANIFDAAKNGSADDVAYYLAQGVRADTKDDDGMTPLHLAAQFNPDPDVLEFLIGQGADVNAKTNGGRTPLDVADTDEHKTILRAAGAPATFRYLFDTAARINIDDIRSFMEQKNTDINKKGDAGLTLLHVVAQYNPDVDVLNFLIAQGTGVNAKTNLGATPLHYAALKNTNPTVLKFLIIQGADIHAKNSRGWTPLHSAATGTSPVEVLKFLIDQGADVNAKTDEGGMPLDYTESEEKQQILRDAGGKSTWK